MSWLLFLDESGHDHKTMPYEIHGGVAIHASKLWPLITAVMTLEQSMFGAYLHEYGSELKGSKLLSRNNFRWSTQGAWMDSGERRKHALNFLNCGVQGRSPRRDEFTAFGQACIGMAEQVIGLLDGHGAKLFAAIIPPLARPRSVPEHLLRKDLVFLLERYYYFLESHGEMGLLVMDGTEKASERELVRLLQRYFTQTMPGRQRTQRIVPAPIFVESDMAYGVQIADLCIYCLNWGWRLANMTANTRPEIEPVAALLNQVIWHGEGQRSGQSFKTHGVTYVPDPYQNR